MAAVAPVADSASKAAPAAVQVMALFKSFIFVFHPTIARMPTCQGGWRS